MKSLIIRMGMTIVMLFSIVHTSAYDFEADGIYYSADIANMTCSVVSGDNLYEGDVVIPSTVTYKDREFTVTAIDGAFSSCENLNSVYVPDEVSVLGNGSFAHCTSLTSVTGMHSIVEISDDCFKGCTIIESVELSNNVKKIGENAFRNCVSLKNISVPNTVIEIGKYAFAGNTSLEQIDLPDNLTIISEGLCKDCKSLLSISIPVHITKIGMQSFKNCESLSSLEIPSNVIEIEDEAFWGCINISSCVVAESSALLTIGNGEARWEGSSYYHPMFYKSPLQKIFIGRNISSRDEACFSYNEYVLDVQISSNVTFIESVAFHSCKNLRSITIPNSVTEIGNSAFYSSGLQSVIIEDGYSNLYIGSGNFKEIREVYLGRNVPKSACFLTYFEFRDVYESKINKITIGNFVDNIESLMEPNNNSMSVHTDLEYIQFGINIANIPDLSENPKLTQLRLTSTTPPSVNPFSNSQYMDLSVEVPEGSIEAYKNAPIWQNFWEIKEEDNLLTCIEDNGLLYQIEDNGELTVIKKYEDYNGDIIVPSEVAYNGKTYKVTSIGEAFSNCTELITVSLPESVINLTNGCFKGCGSLVDVSMSNSITEIPISAFEDCISIINFPMTDNLKYIRASAFKGCTGLKSIEFNNVETIGDSAFENCTSLSDVKLGFSLTSLGQATFKGCEALETMALSSSITTFPMELFQGCIKLNLEDIYAYNVEDRCFMNCESIVNLNLPNIKEIGESAFENCNSLVDIQIGSELTKISDSAFKGCKNLMNVSLPGSLEKIGAYVFSGCSNLKDLRFEDGETPLIFETGSYDSATGIQKKEVNGKTIQFKISYYKGIFDGLGIEKLYLGRNLSDEPRYTISGDGGVDYYNIVTYDNPFYNLPKLEELTIGENVSVLGPKEMSIKEINSVVTSGSFKKCGALEKVTVLNLIPPTGAEFSSTAYEKAIINVPVYSVSQYQKADGWKEFANYAILAETITVEPSSISDVEGSTVQLTVTILPENVTSKEVAWSSSDNSVATVDETGLVTIVSEGSCTIYARTTDGSDLTAECFVTSISGIEEIFEESSAVDVYDINGKLVLKNTSVADFNKLQRGLYIVNGKKVFKTTN